MSFKIFFLVFFGLLLLLFIGVLIYGGIEEFRKKRKGVGPNDPTIAASEAS
jgi:hypothetical protein